MNQDQQAVNMHNRYFGGDIPSFGRATIVKWDDAKFLSDFMPFVCKHWWHGDTTINVLDVVGTRHPDYHGITWLEFLHKGVRMRENLVQYLETPAYYDTKELKTPKMCYLQLDGGNLYVGADGNHRTVVARFGFHAQKRRPVDFLLHGVEVINYKVDWDFKGRFERIKALISSRGLSHSIYPQRDLVDRSDGARWTCHHYSLSIAVVEQNNGRRFLLRTIEEMDAYIVRLKRPELFGKVGKILQRFMYLIFGVVGFLCILSLPMSAADLDQSSVDAVMKKKDEALKKLNIPSNAYDSQARKRAAAAMEGIYSDEYQNKLQAQSEKLKRTLFKDQLVSVSTPTRQKTALSAEERIYVFVSSSVPIQTLRNYAAAIDRSGETNIFMVMRGFVGGMKEWKAMLDFSSSVLVKNSSCDSTKERCDMYAANLQVDPLLFRRYEIKVVPTVVYARGVRRSVAEMSEGLNEVATVSKSYSVEGDASLEYILETIRGETKNASIEAVITALRRNYYDGE